MKIQCDGCNAKVTLMYRVFNWSDDLSDKHFNTIKEAEKYFEKMIKTEPNLGWRLYEQYDCNDCDYDYEELLDFNEQPLIEW